MFKGTSSIVWRIYVDTFDLPGEILLECSERKKIISVDEHIARPRFPIGKCAGFDLPKTIFRGVKEQTWLNSKWLVLLTNPRKFQLIYLVLCH